MKCCIITTGKIRHCHRLGNCFLAPLHTLRAFVPEKSKMHPHLRFEIFLRWSQKLACSSILSYLLTYLLICFYLVVHTERRQHSPANSVHYDRLQVVSAPYAPWEFGESLHGNHPEFLGPSFPLSSTFVLRS